MVPIQSSSVHGLFAPASTLPGIGEKRQYLINRLTEGRGRIIDLLYHFPVGITEWRSISSLSHASEGAAVRCLVEINDYNPARRPGQPHRIGIVDSSGVQGEILVFNTPAPVLASRFPMGERRIVIGELAAGRLLPTFIHPQAVLKVDSAASLPDAVAAYPLTTGLHPDALRRYIRAALNAAPELPEWLPPELVSAHGGFSWKAALEAVHRSNDAKARQRLALDELLARSVAWNRWRHAAQRHAAPLVATGVLSRAVERALPFALTRGQQEAIAACLRDMAGVQPMLRLLQGDVGSGKTMVALFAALAAIEAGAQAALLVPTELLAQQHRQKLAPLLEPLGITPAFLTGRSTGKQKKQTLTQLADGTARLAIGTHALLEDNVHFHQLGLVVIDEQHRFGVQQRLSLIDKAAGGAAHTLVMTATPIPRTLQLVSYHGMDTSILAEKPPGRQPITTTKLSQARVEELLERLDAALKRGEQAYWVCPLVDESDKLALAAAIERYGALAARFGFHQVGLLHGQLKAAEKDAAMQAFSNGETRLLVVTTVVEVGVDVPNATIMIIEQAERFGLAQLHQLRGRVGRGSKPSACVLLHAPQLGDIARQRLYALCRSNDGFWLAEEDLRLRGGGDVVGTAQSGSGAFRAVRLPEDADLFPQVEAITHAVDAHPQIETLLTLFERGNAARLPEAG
ncbi:MAG: ATP-dependent DNA helicase RecG [Holosporales bacterium]